MSDQPTRGGGETRPPSTPEQAARDWSTHVTNRRLAEKIESGVPLPKGEREAMSIREMDHEPEPAVAGVLATGEPVTAEDLDGMPWYEARVEIYVRNGPPGDEYGVGGDKIAHTRAATQAPSFTAAAPRLDEDLGVKWQHILNAAPLADQAPSPDVLPVQVPWWKEPVDVPVWYVLMIFVAMLSLSALAVFT